MAEQIEDEEDLDLPLTAEDEETQSESSEEQPSPEPLPPVHVATPQQRPPPAVPVVDLLDDDEPGYDFSSQHRLIQRREFLKQQIMQAKQRREATKVLESGVNVDCFSTEFVSLDKSISKKLVGSNI